VSDNDNDDPTTTTKKAKVATLLSSSLATPTPSDTIVDDDDVIPEPDWFTSPVIHPSSSSSSQTLLLLVLVLVCCCLLKCIRVRRAASTKRLVDASTINDHHIGEVIFDENESKWYAAFVHQIFAKRLRPHGVEYLVLHSNSNSTDSPIPYCTMAHMSNRWS
jgi:hypothetical protein